MDEKHYIVFDYLKRLKGGKLLDAGGGEGDFYKFLSKKFDVTVCDIDISKVRGVKKNRADLNKKLPYKNSSFDCITCIEVIEHLENPHNLIREFRRVLKTGGILVITTPNIMNVFSRIKFLLTGTFFCFGEHERNLKYGHINPIPFWELKDTLEKNNMKIVCVKSNSYMRICGIQSLKTLIKRLISKFVYIFLYPFLYPKNKEILKGDIIIIISRKL